MTPASQRLVAPVRLLKRHNIPGFDGEFDAFVDQSVLHKRRDKLGVLDLGHKTDVTGQNLPPLRK